MKKLVLAPVMIVAALAVAGPASASTTIIKKRHGRTVVIKKHRMHHGPRVIIRTGRRHHMHGPKIVIRRHD